MSEKKESTGDKKLSRRSMLKWTGVLAAAAAGLAVVGWQLLSPIGSEEYANPEALVSSQWLEQHLQDSDIRVIELLAVADYNEGHIRGSVLVDWLHDIRDPSYPDRYIVANKETIELLLGTIGVKEDTSIVLVDDLQNRLSMVMFWILRYYGHEKVRILNGGRVAWEVAGKTYTDQTTEVTQTKYTVKNVNENYRVRFDFISGNLNNPNVLLIDSRFQQQYTGEEPGIVYNTGKQVKRRGHIPGAINIPWNSNLREDNTYKPHDELLQMFTDKGITKDKSIVTYCNEGIHAEANWFVLHELLGYPDVAVYNESMAEWANRDDVPMTLGANP